MMLLAETRRAPAPLYPGRAEDRRRSPRLVPDRPLFCHLESADGTTIPAVVYNLSASGIALVTTRAVICGSRYRLMLVNAGAMFCVWRTLTIVRCERHPSGWVVAGPFDEPLALDDLRPFLV